MKLDLQRVPLSTLASFMVAVAAHPHTSAGVIADFAGGMSLATAKRAIPVLTQLKLIAKDSSGLYKCSRPEVQRGTTTDQALLVIKRALHNFRPFEALCEGLLLGEEEEVALRRAAIILEVENPEALHLLMQWGVEIGILVREGKALKLSPELVWKTSAVSVATISSRDITSEAAARLYNASRIGRDANNFLDEVDRSLLADAQMECSTSPDDALEKAGKALEDYLRELAKSRGFGTEASKCNGAGQLGSALVGLGVIHSHQNQIIQAISTARNMTAHHKDKKTLIPWHISEAAARWGLSGTLTIIHSIHEYIHQGQQVL